MKILDYLSLVVVATFFILPPISGCAQQQERKEKKPDKMDKNRIERISQEQPTTISTIMDADTPTIRHAVINRFEELQKQHKEKFGYFDVCTKDSQIFPEDIQMKAYISNNKSLANYLMLPASAREQDLYVYNVSGDYWITTDEYHCNGEPAKFQSNFLIHLSRKRQKQTMIEIIQYQPNVWCGREFYEGRHGPGWYNNVKWVSPTKKDSQELLQAIGIAIKNKQAYSLGAYMRLSERLSRR